MTDTIVSALVAGSVSIIISIISFFAVLKKTKDESRLFQEELQSKYTGILYEIRLETYPLAFEITDMLLKVTTDKDVDSVEIVKKVNRELRQWRNGLVNLIISEKSLQAYHNLINCFKTNPYYGNSYNDNQVERIKNLRSEFRNALRNDVHFLHRQDSEQTSSKVFKSLQDKINAQIK